MKKILLLAFLSFSTPFINSCSSDDSSSTTEIKEKSIIGKWRFSKSVYNGEVENISDCELKETFDFNNQSQLIITTYYGSNCQNIDNDYLTYNLKGDELTYTNPTGGYNGGEFTRKFKVRFINNNLMQLDLFYEIDGFEEEGYLSDKWVTQWTKVN